MRIARECRMTNITSYKDLEVWQVSEVIRRRKLVPQPLLTRGSSLAERTGQMLHGLVRSLE